MTLLGAASLGQDLQPLLEPHSGHQRAPDSAQTNTSYPEPGWGGAEPLGCLPAPPSHPAHSRTTPYGPTSPRCSRPVCDVHSSPRPGFSSRYRPESQRVPAARAWWELREGQ